MSGLVGKGVRSYKKAIVSDSNFPALGFVNFIMAFENMSGDLLGPVTISLIGALDVPQEMVDEGFQQPDGITIGNAQLGTFRNNVVVTSNLNGVLIDRISYTLTNDSITFDDGLNAGEIIVIKRGNEAVTGNRIVDARPLRASGNLDYSQATGAIFQVGEGFRIAPSTTSTGGIDNRQIGFVQVFVDGVLQARNAGNLEQTGATQTGNYREVIVDGLGALLATQNGVTANAIQLNPLQSFAMMDPIIVISTNLIVDSPNNTGVIDQLSTLQSQITQNDTELSRIPTPVGGTPADIIQVNAGGTAYELVTPSSGGGGSLQIREQAHDTGHSTGAYQWICPEGVSDIRLSLAGCGAGGGSTNGNLGAPGGGGAGGYIIDEVIVGLVSAETYTISIPAGGTGAGGNATITGTFYSLASHEISCLGGLSGAGGTGFPNFAGGAGGAGGAVGGVRVNGAFNNITTGGAGGTGGGGGAAGQGGILIWKNDLTNVDTSTGGALASFGGGGGGGSSRASGGNGANGSAGVTGGAGGGGGWLFGVSGSGSTGGRGGHSGIRIEFVGAASDGNITQV